MTSMFRSIYSGTQQYAFHSFDGFVKLPHFRKCSWQALWHLAQGWILHEVKLKLCRIIRNNVRHLDGVFFGCLQKKSTLKFWGWNATWKSLGIPARHEWRDRCESFIMIKIQFNGTETSINYTPKLLETLRRSTIVHENRTHTRSKTYGSSISIHATCIRFNWMYHVLLTNNHHLEKAAKRIYSAQTLKHRHTHTPYKYKFNVSFVYSVYVVNACTTKAVCDDFQVKCKLLR